MVKTLGCGPGNDGSIPSGSANISSERKPLAMKQSRSCKLCSAPTERKMILCRKCRTLCCLCRKRPKANLTHSYCRECDAQRKRMEPAERLCRHCKLPVAPPNLVCATCKATCTICRAAPAESGAWCKPCHHKKQAEYRQRWQQQPGYLEGKRLREKINDEIERGKRAREPCAICEASPTFIYVKNAKRRQFMFLCRPHFEEMKSDRTSQWMKK